MVKANTTAIDANLGGLPGFIDAVQPNGSDPVETTPQAFLTILFFDERFNFIDAVDGGLAQQRVAASVGADGSTLAHSDIQAPKNGYAYVYISNQSAQDVYFDNFKVQVVAGNIIEENHYYAYGLKIAAISSKKLGVSNEGVLKNSYLYNGKELFEDGDLNWYDYGFRNYDPQIGRFTQLDPLTYDYPFYTPYQYAGCEPIANVDLDGLEPEPVVKAITGFATQGVSNISAHVAAAGINAGKWVVAGFKNGVAVSKVIHNTGQLFQRLVLACEILGITTKTLSVTERAIQLSRPTGDLGSNFGIPNQSELAKNNYHQTLDLIKHDWHPIDVSMRSFYGLPEGGKINWTTGEIRANETSIEMTEDPITLLGPGLIRGMTAKLASGIGFAAKGGNSSAHLATEGANLSKHLGQLEKYGQAGFKELQNGRFRYYGNVTPASTPGEMIGRRVVREWNPANGGTRTWMENLDGAGRIRIVRPETGGTKVHFMFDKSGNFIKKW